MANFGGISQVAEFEPGRLLEAIEGAVGMVRAKT
jgi:hypothetical protein